MLSTLLTKTGQTLSDLLFPPKCVHCKADDSWLCQTCLSKISFITATVCQRCGTPPPVNHSTPQPCEQCKNNPLHYIDGIRVASFFENNPIRSAIHYLKYRDHKAIAAALGQILVDTYRRYHLSTDVIVPVPLHSSRVKERGYNQSELLTQQLGNLLGLPVNTTTLWRTRKTKSQMKLGAAERHKNVANAFACTDNQLANRRVLLVDDVCTTGSTLDACAAALKMSGVDSVWGLTLAKAR